jgi:hypothetical protein
MVLSVKEQGTNKEYYEITEQVEQKRIISKAEVQQVLQSLDEQKAYWLSVINASK